ncbi:MAG TPA: LysM peptidoglycan-binding domain-containing protein [Anaerolineae bacterium]|nr:LysM peptidoglycan-binding domain-containing protein [Anaerolineae bacterium]
MKRNWRIEWVLVLLMVMVMVAGCTRAVDEDAPSEATVTAEVVDENEGEENDEDGGDTPRLDDDDDAVGEEDDDGSPVGQNGGEENVDDEEEIDFTDVEQINVQISGNLITSVVTTTLGVTTTVEQVTDEGRTVVSETFKPLDGGEVEVIVEAGTDGEEAEAEETGETTDDENDNAEEATEEEATEEEAAEEADAVDEEATEEEVEESEEVEEPSEPVAIPDTHIVQSGENLYRIGLHYGISWVTLAELNHLSNPSQLQVGDEIRLTGTVDTPATPSPTDEVIYIVQTNDTLFTIGLMYGLTWDLIADANGLESPNDLYVGQELKIPANMPGVMPSYQHEVQPRETLQMIALYYGVRWQTIAEANQLVAPYVIYPGQVLVIPGS